MASALKRHSGLFKAVSRMIRGLGRRNAPLIRARKPINVMIPNVSKAATNHGEDNEIFGCIVLPKTGPASAKLDAIVSRDVILLSAASNLPVRSWYDGWTNAYARSSDGHAFPGSRPSL